MTDDSISRQAAIDAECAACSLNPPRERWHNCRYYVKGCPEVESLRNLPSADPQRKKGKWIKMSDADGIYFCCSECGEDLPRTFHFDREYDLFPHLKSIKKTNYCPNCGAVMVKGE